MSISLWVWSTASLNGMLTKGIMRILAGALSLLIVVCIWCAVFARTSSNSLVPLSLLLPGTVFDLNDIRYL